ncbi:hypothetical protein [Pseudomonas donghuensis]|uniref:hypothetical protein n=1 Tax=Pseudomonas donghuensis TaxID=1163398 RepID=UPI000299E08F|nr:hypothetical protein [Pseudomonas donghuensis]MDF9893478.1 hypothetical protein [Pseudomonas vranovensis]UVL26860.1 hypothetical protein LOY30_13065 [Pseudomonas donghuensis]UVL31849.1 hypothetical protein LOY32_12390 [Pseudomonas donghuensis]
MRILIGAVAVALLAGCVSTADLEQNKPSITASTAKDPKRYALCVFPKWQASRTDASMAETEDGYRLWVAGNNMADELLDIRKTASGSSVTLRQRMAWSAMPGRSGIEAAVRSCL